MTAGYSADQTAALMGATMVVPKEYPTAANLVGAMVDYWAESKAAQ